MTFLLSCECGKKLRAKDEWRGTRVKCPACGHVIAIPGTPVQAAVPSRADRPAKSPAKTTNQMLEDVDLDASRPAKGKRKKKKRRFRFRVPEIDILGVHMTLSKWIVFICLGTVIGGGIYFLLPNYECSVIEARWVDVFGALDVRNPNSGNPLTRHRGPTLIPGGDQFLIVRDNPEGAGVQIRLKVPPKVRTRHHDMAQAGTFNLTSGSFLLQGDGTAVKPLLVELEKTFPDPDGGVTVDFSEAGTADPVIPRHRAPWNPAGDFVNDTFKVETIKPKDLSGDQKPRVFITGTGEFKGKRGMEVHYDFQGAFVTVTWDRGSRGHVGTGYQDFLDSWFDVWELVLIFPRPASQELTLTVMGDNIGRVKPR
jgi:hypothetical protein